MELDNRGGAMRFREAVEKFEKENNANCIKRTLGCMNPGGVEEIATGLPWCIACVAKEFEGGPDRLDLMYDVAACSIRAPLHVPCQQKTQPCNRKAVCALPGINGGFEGFCSIHFVHLAVYIIQDPVAIDLVKEYKEFIGGTKDKEPKKTPDVDVDSDVLDKLQSRTGRKRKLTAEPTDGADERKVLVMAAEIPANGAQGAIPIGTQVIKRNSNEDDWVKDGHLGKVLTSTGPTDHHPHGNEFVYLVAWDRAQGGLPMTVCEYYLDRTDNLDL
jgi:hypothetical protein